MKTKALLLALTIVMVIFSCKNKSGTKAGSESTEQVQAPENIVTETPSFHKYGIKSGIVTFETDIVGMKLKTILYFDDFGIREAEEKYEGETVESISLCNGKERFTVMPLQKSAFTGGTCSRGIAYRFAWDEISSEDKGTKAKKLANMTVAGKDCESYSYDTGSSVAVYAGWQNINLYLKTTAGGTEVIMQATKIEENAEIPVEKFQVPSDYAIKAPGTF